MKDTVNSAKYSRKITWIALIINLALSGFKFIGGMLGASQVVIADAVHSLSDCATDVAVIIGSYYWSRPPDEDHPYGHRRIETLVAVLIGFLLMIAGIGICWQAIVTLSEKHTRPPGWIAFWAAATSIVCKELLYRWHFSVGKRIKSPAVIANAWHHRSDAFSSIPALVAVGGALFFPAWSFLDHVGAVVVSIFIFQSACNIMWPGLRELVDAGAPKEKRERIKALIQKNESIKQVHRIRTRYVSSSLHVDLHLVVDGSISVIEGHDIAEAVKEQIINDGGLDVVDVTVHIEPTEAALPEQDRS
ncbi:MAG: cation diffusion facilitator family transporter [Desulfobacterales bacterium]|nr:cation diffusion facilitator family transporter [Desulfobacterales bacterium]